MDITLEKCSVWKLPSHNRVGAIVHGGTADAQLWPARGPDAELKYQFGDDLQKTLDAELSRLGVRRLDLGQAMRVGRGRLHCDFLLWVATREPEPGADLSRAPREAALTAATRAALSFVAERGVERVAFTGFGGGAEELPPVERWLAIAKAAQAYEDECRAAGRSTVVEEVLLCEADGKLHSLAKARLGSLARAPIPPKPAAPEAPVRREARKATDKPATRRGAPRLSADEVDAHRFTAGPYSMRTRYDVGQYMLHARFGVGRVDQVLPEGAVVVVFEDGESRKMVHGRS